MWLKQHLPLVLVFSSLCCCLSDIQNGLPSKLSQGAASGLYADNTYRFPSTHKEERYMKSCRSLWLQLISEMIVKTIIFW